MAIIDDKVVAMSFESSKFESGVNSTVNALDKLKASLKLPGASKGLDDVGAAAKKIDLSHIGQGIDNIQNKLSYFSVAALAVFANIAMKAVQAGAQVAKAFTLDPIIAGYKEYAVNLNSIQTILANTQVSGATLKDVNAALLELNKYSDKTIYNFAQMARNIGTFTAAGVDLDTSVGAIKGIANLAALSGSNAEQASTAMYQLSQAISAGSVKLMDWNSVVNAGMGGTVFQRALAQTAETMGTLKKGTVELTGPMKNVTIAGQSFRNSLSVPGKDSWLTSKVLTTTLKQFTGDLKDSELAAMGFNAAQIKAIQQTAKTAMFAATEVKTLSQVLDVAKETAGSGWAQTWQIIFGDFGEAKKTFTDLSNAINGFINKNAEARNKVLGDWKALGGRTILINSIKTAFTNLGLIIQPIKDAFRDIFPATTGRSLLDATKRFQEFAKALKPSAETVDNLHRTFRGLFAVLDIGKQIISGIFTVFKELFNAAGGGSGGFLSLTASIGDFLVSIDKALKEGGRLHNFFVALAHVISAPLAVISTLAGAIGHLFSGFATTGFATSLNTVTQAATPLQAVLQALSNAWDSFSDSIKKNVDLSSAIEGIGIAISGIGVAIGHAFANMNFEVILSAIRTGLFGALVVMFKQFLGRGSFLNQVTKGFGKGIIGNVSSAFGSLSGSMKAMQNNIKAKTLKEIAIAIALLAASVLALSLVKPDRLNAALGAMTIMFGELIGAMALLDKVAKGGGFLKLPIIIAGLVGLAVAIDLLTIAVIAMSRLSWNELIKGLTGIGGLLLGISVAVKPLSTSSGGLIRAGIGIIAIAVAMKILASAMADFGTMSWTEISKGLISVGIGLGIITVAARVMPKGLVIMGTGLIVVAEGLKVLANAVLKFGLMDWRTMGKGLSGIGGSLAIIAGAMRLMPKNMVVTAAGLAIVALSLGKISDAVVKMGGMSIREIAKGIGTLAASLVILAVALHGMTGTLAGAAALTITAAGIAVLAPALTMLGKQSWGQILKGLVTLGATLVILGAAGYALGPVVPALLGLGAAVVLVGAGLALAGAGILLFSTGLSALMVTGPAAIGILVAALKELLNAVPDIAKNFALALVAIIDALAQSAPKFVAAMVKIVESLLDVIIKSAPKMGEAITTLLGVMLKVLADNQDKIIAAGFSLLIALLKGIKDNIAQVTTMVVDIVVKFLGTLAANIGRIVAAGADLLVKFLKGIADNLGKIVTAVFDIITKFITAIGTNFVRVVKAGADLIVKLVEGIGSNTTKIVKAAGDAIISFITTIGGKALDIVNAGTKVMIKFIEGLGKNTIEIINAAGQAIVDFIRGLRLAVEKYAPQIRTESAKLGVAIIDGMTFGLISKAPDLYNKAKEIAKNILGFFGNIFDFGSPSKETFKMGQYIVQGLALGMADYNDIVNSATALCNRLINTFNTILQTASPSKVMIQIGQYVGQGFAQGLRGSSSDINAAFTELQNKLTEAITTARETITSEEAKLDELRKAKKPDTDAIKKAQEIINQNESLLQRSIATRKLLVGGLKDEKNELIGLVNQYEAIKVKIQAAQQALAQAQQTRQDAITGYTSQYATLPDIPTTDADGNPIDQLTTYMDALANQTQAVATYKQTLEQLRKLGLDDATYQKLLTEGTADQSFANQLLAGGKTAVESLNVLDANLLKVSKTLATNAANNLYKGGVDAAKGLLRGLTSQNAKIRQSMEDISDDIVAIVKRKLHITSPSKVFEEIGSYSMQGLANGFSKSSTMVTNAVEDAAKSAINSLRSTMSNISDIVTKELNPNPIITPILDLAQVRSQSDVLNRLMKVTPITAAASYGQASMISSAQIAAQIEEMSTSVGPTVKFEQNNYSPKALTEIEIYRQTQNQLSRIKSVVFATT